LESVDSAKQELDRIKSKTGSLVVFLRQGRFRLAREFTNRDAAVSQLSSLQTLVRSDAYIVDLSSWCPKPLMDSTGVRNCDV
jgi:hypothetical protein